jgi:predicted GTPase
MSRTRIVLLAVLAFAPFLFLMGAGSYHLWATGWMYLAWWPMAASLTAAYALGWYWTRRQTAKLLPGTGVERPLDYWTDRDRAAWKLVEERAAAVEAITPADIEDPNRYTMEAVNLAMAVARIYHPSAKDPFGHLTLPEILACGELVAHDLTRKVNSYLPFSHMVTVNQWRQARKAVDWGTKAWNLSWLARAVIDPVRAGTQFLASKAGGSMLTRMQNNVLLWFYTAYVHELGRYLIELNSGRLKVGAKRYLELINAHQTPPTEAPPTPPTEPAVAAEDPETPPPTAPEAPAVTVAVVGQVKAGKSSLVNALLGEYKAATDVLPLTAGVVRYVLNRPGLPRLTLMDTAGYGAGGPNESEFEEAFKAAQEADVLLFAGHARSAARKADADLLARLTARFAAAPHLRLPPILGVLTHVDLLSPAVEWKPPYDWRAGTRPKEANMREAVAAAKEQLGLGVLDVYPVCTAAGREFGLTDGLVPAMAAHMDHARGSALLRVFHLEGKADAGRKAVGQLVNAGREALKILWESAKKP